MPDPILGDIDEKLDEEPRERPRKTSKYMTKYERARILGTRALQIRSVFPFELFMSSLDVGWIWNIH